MAAAPSSSVRRPLPLRPTACLFWRALHHLFFGPCPSRRANGGAYRARSALSAALSSARTHSFAVVSSALSEAGFVPHNHPPHEQQPNQDDDQVVGTARPGKIASTPPQWSPGTRQSSPLEDRRRGSRVWPARAKARAETRRTANARPRPGRASSPWRQWRTMPTQCRAQPVRRILPRPRARALERGPASAVGRRHSEIALDRNLALGFNPSVTNI